MQREAGEKPGLWKLAPAIVTKPWGLVHETALRFTGVTVGVGEFWLASAQTGADNYSNAVVEPELRKNLAVLLKEAADAGGDALELLIGKGPAANLKANPHRGKTEAWYVRAAEGRTGVAAGPRAEEDARRLESIIRNQGLEPHPEAWSGEVRRLFGLIEPLKGGEVFLAPAGTLHTMFAIGPQSRLIIDEIQEGYGESLLPTLSKILAVQNDLLSVQVHPDDEAVAAVATGQVKVDQDFQANPTVRIYDFGRRPGEKPELGFRLVDPGSGLRRVAPVAVPVLEGHTVELMVADTHFVKSRVKLWAAGAYDVRPRYGSYRVLHCVQGSAELAAGHRTMLMERGETVFVPACLEEELEISAESDCVFFDDALADLAVLSKFLGTHGIGADRIEALLSPPRAV
jgi:mannose-6-phosphate isomerase-like protein (cupin superfamily)